MTEVLTLAPLVGIPTLLLLYVLFNPDKAEKIAGWIVALGARLWHSLDRRAVALKVQGDVNDACTGLFKSAPKGLLESKLRIKWADAEDAKAVVESGEVIVFMRRGPHHSENVAHALMAYLPKALLRRARRYVDESTVRAADLTVAKAVLCSDSASEGALDVLYEEHLDPAADDGLEARLKELDEIDLHGWLVRVLLPEFRRLGNRLHPAPPQPEITAETEKFARWLGRIASKKPGDTSESLVFRGKYFRVGLIFVAMRTTLETKGTEPYRKRAKRYLWSDLDAVYLMARDRNMEAAVEVADAISREGIVEPPVTLTYRLREDFAARRIARERACLISLRRARSGDPGAAEEPDDQDLPEEVLDVEPAVSEAEAVLPPEAEPRVSETREQSPSMSDRA